MQSFSINETITQLYSYCIHIVFISHLQPDLFLIKNMHYGISQRNITQE